MKISIVIPMFNVEKYIARALQSCIEQTHQNIEIIVVDDKSEDGSYEVARSFARTNSQIHCLSNESNMGLFYTRQKGATYASRVGGGDIFMFLDGDDYLELDACQKVAEEFSKNDIDLCIFQFKYQKDKTKYQEKSFFDANHLFDIEEFEKFWIRNGGHNTLNSLCNKGFKKELYIKNYEEHLKAIQERIQNNIQQKIQMAEDVITSIPYLSYVKNVSLLNRPLYVYCFNELSITNKKVNFAACLQDLSFAMNFLKQLQSHSKTYNQLVEIVICNLKIHSFDLSKIHSNFFARLKIKIQRKMTKIKKKNLIKQVI